MESQDEGGEEKGTVEKWKTGNRLLIPEVCPDDVDSSR